VKEFKGVKIPDGENAKKVYSIGYAHGKKDACEGFGPTKKLGCFNGRILCSECLFYRKNRKTFEEYLNEGGKDVSEFKEGDRVKVNNKAASNIGEEGVITKIYDNGDRFELELDIGSRPSYYSYKLDKLSTKTQTTKENNMNKNISEVFDKTKDALLVEKHLGGQIGPNFIDGLILLDKKVEVLAEAKRLEKEEKEGK
jgi:hypothetical protein